MLRRRIRRYGRSVALAWRVVQENPGADVHKEQDDSEPAAHAQNLVARVVCEEVAGVLERAICGDRLGAAIEGGEERGWQKDGEYSGVD